MTTRYRTHVNDGSGTVRCVGALHSDHVVSGMPLITDSGGSTLMGILRREEQRVPVLNYAHLVSLGHLGHRPRFTGAVIRRIGNMRCELRPGDPGCVLPVPPSILHFGPSVVPGVEWGVFW